MFTGEWMYWLSWLGVLLLIAALVFVSWWSLFADRSRGRRRCPRCWYDMAYSPGMTCAECGFEGTREKQFYRTRRRYGVAIVAIVGSVAVSLVVNESITQRGLPGLLPNRALIWLMPLAGDNGAATTGIIGELQTRASSGAFSNDHWIAYIDRCASGDFRALPVSDPWIRKYGALIGYWRVQFVGDAALEPLLMNLPPRLDVEARPSWPTDTPMTVNVSLRDWWPWGMECRIRATPRIGGKQAGPPLVFHRTGDDRFQRTPYALDLPGVVNPGDHITIDFEIERRRMAGVAQTGRFDPDAKPESWQPVMRQSIALKTKFQGRLADAIAPAQGQELSTSVAQVFQTGVHKWLTGESPVRFQINSQVTFLPSFDDTIVGVKAELFRDDQIARRLHIWWLAGAKVVSNADRNYGFEVDFEDPELLRQVNSIDGRWTMRITGDRAIALRAGAAPKYWAGEVILPLRLHQNTRAPSPPRPWWTETSDE